MSGSEVQHGVSQVCASNLADTGLRSCIAKAGALFVVRGLMSPSPDETSGNFPNPTRYSNSYFSSAIYLDIGKPMIWLPDARIVATNPHSPKIIKCFSLQFLWLELCEKLLLN